MEKGLLHAQQPLFPRHQGRCGVDSGQEFLVQGVEPFGVAAEKFEFLDQVADVLFFFSLFLHEPVEELHGPVILGLVGGCVDLVDAAGDELFVFQGGFQGVVQFLVGHVRLVDGAEDHRGVVVLQVGPHEHGMVPFFLGLDVEPVGEAVQPLFLIIVGKIQIQIGRIKFLGDLFVDQVSDFVVQHG